MSPRVIEDPIVIDLPRAIALSSLSKSTLRAHIRCGNLPVNKIGRRILINLEDFKRFLARPLNPPPRARRFYSDLSEENSTEKGSESNATHES